jgi:hypothetical protein
MLAFRCGACLVFALTYGPGTQWVHNVLAAGACDFEARGATYHLTGPRRFHDPARRAVPRVVGWVLAALGTAEFLELRIVAVDRDPSGAGATREAA